MRRTLGFLSGCALVVGILSADARADEAKEIRFKKTHIDAAFRSEGVAVGDFNKDGLKDIVAGYVWFEAPDWKMHKLVDDAKEYDPRHYSNSFCNWVEDVNKDGWDDVIVVDFPGTPTWWFANPQGKEGPWQRNVCIAETSNESPTYLDLDGDGARELLCSAANRFVFVQPTAEPWIWRPVSISTAMPQFTQRFYHGLGVGDVNKDGRTDVVIPHGWFECPAEDKATDWTFHRIEFDKTCAQMYVFDFDGDGDNDIAASCAHQYGIWWLEQLPDGWKVHEIDMSVSETHSMCFADINQDGLPDLVTGKRYWSHHTAEPGSSDPAVIAWYELSRENGKPSWKQHVIDHDSGVGTQFEVVDFNGDGLLDVVSSNKKGTHLLIQQK